MFKSETYGLYQTLLSHDITKLKRKERTNVVHKLNNLNADKQMPLLFLACEKIKTTEDEGDLLAALENYGIKQNGGNIIIDFDTIPEDLQNMFLRFSLLGNDE